jgi:hypothetical protein
MNPLPIRKSLPHALNSYKKRNLGWGAGRNGTNLSTFGDTAPTGQKLNIPQTQGGAGACLGLWEAAPMGLKIDPFGYQARYCYCNLKTPRR